MDESSFSVGGGPPADPRGGGVGLPICNMHQGEGEPRGGGTMMSHPLQEGVGDRDESTKRGVSQGRLHQGAVLALQNTVSPQTVLISKRWVRSGYYTTPNYN